MILLGSFFLGILVGLFIERHHLGVTSWGSKGGVPSSRSHRSSRGGRRSHRKRSGSAWELKPSRSTVPSSSLPFSSVPTSCPVSTTGSVCTGVSSRPRRLKRLGKMIGFGRPGSKVTWVDGSTTTER